MIMNTGNKLKLKLKIPHIIKYMGSKRSLIEYLVSAIDEIHEGEKICDLFAGTSVLSDRSKITWIFKLLSAIHFPVGKLCNSMSY